MYLLPKFAELYGMPLDSIVGLGHAINPSINSVTTLALFAVAPMNLMKGGIVSIVTMLIYKKTQPHPAQQKIIKKAGHCGLPGFFEGGPASFPDAGKL